MQLPLEIDYRNVPFSVPIDALIRLRTDQLSRCCPPLIGCQVTVESPPRHPGGKACTVSIRLAIPGSVVVVNCGLIDDGSQDLYATIGDAFDVAERQLDDRNRKCQRDERCAG
jgi:hypothetical protein